jgi:hypothetical protein
MLLECPDCEALVDATQIADYEWRGNEEEPPETITLLKCPKCYRPMLAYQYLFDCKRHTIRTYPGGSIFAAME